MSISFYRTEEGRNFVRDLSPLEETLQSLHGNTRKALYGSIPQTLERWNHKMPSPDYHFKFKWLTGIGIFVGIGVILPLAVVLGLSSDGFTISVAMGSYSAALVSLSVIAFFVTHFFHNRFMNGQLKEKDVARVKEKITTDLQICIREEMVEISSKYKGAADLTKVSKEAKYQLESLHYLGRLANIQTNFMKKINFQQFIKEMDLK